MRLQPKGDLVALWKSCSYRGDAAVVDAPALFAVPHRPQGIPVKKQEGRSPEMKNISNLIH